MCVHKVGNTTNPTMLEACRDNLARNKYHRRHLSKCAFLISRKMLHYSLVNIIIIWWWETWGNISPIAARGNADPTWHKGTHGYTQLHTFPVFPSSSPPTHTHLDECRGFSRFLTTLWQRDKGKKNEKRTSRRNCRKRRDGRHPYVVWERWVDHGMKKTSCSAFQIHYVR